jgi:hypothetical protein
MKATSTKSKTVTLKLKESGAKVLQDAFVFSKTIGRAVAEKKRLTGEDAANYAGALQRCLRRVRKALENIDE